MYLLLNRIKVLRARFLLKYEILPSQRRKTFNFHCHQCHQVFFLYVSSPEITILARLVTGFCRFVHPNPPWTFLTQVHRTCKFIQIHQIQIQTHPNSPLTLPTHARMTCKFIRWRSFPQLILSIFPSDCII